MSNFAKDIEALIPRLRRYARALVNDKQQADDLVQDCLLRAWERLHLWRKGSDLRAWLFTIMHNLYINQYHKQKRSPTTVPIEGIVDLADPMHSPEAEMHVNDLQNAIHQLPHEMREVLLLIALEGMQYNEVASILGIPTGTVMSRLFRAREKLKTWLTGEQHIGLRSVT